MNRPSSLCFVLAAVVGAGLQAAEAAPSADGLSGAARDYESISRAHSSSELQKLDGTAPTPSTQNLTLGESAAGSANSLGGTGRVVTPAKSSNWLVDAVMEQKPSPLEELKGEISSGSRPSESKLPSAVSKPGEGAVNPLTSYMAEWMTPHDFEVLKVKEADGKPSLLPDKPVVGDNPRDNFPRNDLAAGGGSSSLSVGGLSADARSNPYLTDLAPGFADTKSPLAPAAPPPAPLASPQLPNDLAPMKDAGLPANALKAQDDAKYFPQLKRF